MGWLGTGGAGAGATHDRPKVSLNDAVERSLVDERGRGGGSRRKKMIEIAREALCNEPNSVEIKPSLSSFATRSTGAIYPLFLFIRKSEQLNGARFGDQAEGDVIEGKKTRTWKAYPFPARIS